MTFRLPPYPYDRLDGLAKLAAAHPEGMVDCSIGTPYDPPLPAVVEALATSGTERGYPASAGSPQLRHAAGRVAGPALRPGRPRRTRRSPPASAPRSSSPRCPTCCGLRRPGRDTVLYPAVSYPTYAMGAELAGCRAVAVPAAPGRSGGLDLEAIDPEDAGRALVLWSNSPSNPTGGLGDLGAEAAWGRERAIPVFSDECYAEFTWDGPPRSVLEHGTDGVVAVHSLSKRSNLAGVRVGFYAGRRRTGRVPPRGAPARRSDGPWSRAGGRGRRAGRRRARGPPAGALPRAAASTWPRSWRPTGAPSRFPRVGSISGSPYRPVAGPMRGPWPSRWPVHGGRAGEPG